MNPKAQALLDAHIAFIEQQFKQNDTITEEVLGFFAWFKEQKIGDIWSDEHVNALAQKQVLSMPITPHLVSQIEEHIVLALQHPQNDNTTIEDILPSETVDQIAHYIASKSEYRQQMIRQLVNNPAYVELIANIIQQSMKDYMDNSAVTKKVPGVGSLMKMGKSVIEKATDTNLDDALRNYLHKNFHKLSNLSEKLMSQNFNDEKLYQVQMKFWQRIKTAPLSSLQRYVVMEDLPKTVGMGEQVWNHLRQTPYLQAQVATGVEAWIKRHEQETFAKALSDINLNEELLRSELYHLVTPILQQLIESGYLLERARFYLEQFYASEQITAILES